MGAEATGKGVEGTAEDAETADQGAAAEDAWLKDREPGGDRQRRIEMVKRACKAADEAVSKMEYWSDIKDIARKGESLTLEEGEPKGLGTSGASVGNEKIIGERERADTKGKGKEAVR